MFGSKPLTAGLAVLLLIASVVPATAAAGTGSADGSAAASATVHVEVTENATILTVESEGEAMTGADLQVESVGNATYEGSGEYETDANGQVRLPAPDDEATVRVDLRSESVDGEAVVTLTAPESGAFETTVIVEADAGILAEIDAWIPVDFGFAVDAEDGSASADASDDDGLFGLDFDLTADAEADGYASADAESDSDVESDSDAESSAEVETGVDVDSSVDSDVETDSDADSDGETSADADSDGETSADADSDTEVSGGLTLGA